MSQELEHLRNVAGRISASKCLQKCWVCGDSFWGYPGLKVVPPEPESVKTVDDIGVIATCGDDYCMRMELDRQKALFNVVIIPVLEKYRQRKKEEAEAERKRRQAEGN